MRTQIQLWQFILALLLFFFALGKYAWSLHDKNKKARDKITDKMQKQKEALEKSIQKQHKESYEYMYKNFVQKEACEKEHSFMSTMVEEVKGSLIRLESKFEAKINELIKTINTNNNQGNIEKLIQAIEKKNKD